jgi:protein-disulfide isomerase
VQAYVARLNNIENPERLKAVQVSVANGECFWLLKYGSVTSAPLLTMYLSPDFKYVTPTLLDLSVDPQAEQRKRQKVVAAALSAGKPPSTSPIRTPVTIVEFSDFQCPFCKRQSEALEKRVLPKSRERVRLEYRFFPLSIHSWAREAAEVAACASVQRPESFWTVHDYLFDHQSALVSGQIHPAVRELLESTAGFDVARFDKCVAEHEQAGTVRADESLGRGLGVQATPTLFVNGLMLKGVHSAEQILEAVHRAETGTDDTVKEANGIGGLLLKPTPAEDGKGRCVKAGYGDRP